MATRGLNLAESAVYEALVRAAEAGAYCPTNHEICDLVGAKSVSAGANAIALLERRGLIAVRRFSRGREVTIKATSKSTAAHSGSRAPHWRIAGVGANAHSKGRSPYIRVADRTYQPIAEEALPPAIDRNPCFRCGIRADIGCSHNPLPAAGQAPGSRLGRAAHHSGAPALSSEVL